MMDSIDDHSSSSCNHVDSHVLGMLGTLHMPSHWLIWAGGGRCQTTNQEETEAYREQSEPRRNPESVILITMLHSARNSY